MTVSVKFFANVRTFMGKEKIALSLAGSRKYSIREILAEIERTEKKSLFPLIFESEEVPLRSVRVVLNGKIIHSLESNEKMIQDGDHIAIFPLLAGG